MTGGPGTTAFDYYKCNNSTNVQPEETTNWMTVFYDSFTEANLVWGFTGTSNSARSDGSPSMFLGTIDLTDADGDGVENAYDLDSDNDGCSDSNEYYIDSNYAGKNMQFQQTVLYAHPAVYPNGTVKLADATYPTGASYLAVTTASKGGDPSPLQQNVDLGATTTFSANPQGVSGSYTTYQWQVRVNSTAAWTDISNAGVYSGADTKNLTITGVLVGMNNYEYQVIVDDNALLGGNYICGKLTSATAKLKLNNIPPVANNDVLTVNEDTSGTVNVITNDTDADGTVDVAKVDLDPVTIGIQTTFTVAGQGTYTVANTGLVTFTPALNYNGTSSISYTVNDNLGTPSNVATLTITITPVNDAPLAVNDVASTNEDTSGTFNVTTNDTDVDGTIDVTKVDLDPATTGVQTTFTVAGQGTYTVNTVGLVTFVPVLNYNGTATPINYTVNDNSGLVSNSATLTFTVIPVNDAPVANNDVATTARDTNVIIQVAGNDTDIDGTINPATIDLDPLTAGIQATFTVAGEGTYTANANGTVTFDPLATFGGTLSVNYVIQDNQGGVSNSAKITITVNADSDGDGVLDTTEIADGTDPLDFCDSKQEHATETQSVAFLSADCDDDGLTNEEEYGSNYGKPFDSNGNGISDYLEVNKHNLSNSDDDLEIFNGISPSSDDPKNNVFTIRNIEKYPNNTMQIFNRWGVLVYEATGYGIGNKFFRGESEGRTTISASSSLPEDTYFYVLKYVNTSGTAKERSGYLYINR